MEDEGVKYVHDTSVHNTISSDIVVPILINLFSPRSVLDVGCGLGTWLNSFIKFGVHDVYGVDGGYVDRTLLSQNMPVGNFVPLDLTNHFNLGRRFDLVISLEVAEHLPKTSAMDFVNSLCKHSDIVIFSAAIPHQGGQNHLNEQWKEYWINLFDKNGYKCYDILRNRIWKIEKIDWWYKQNILVFSRNEFSRKLENNNEILEWIHPECYLSHVDYIIYLQGYVKELEQKLYK